MTERDCESEAVEQEDGVTVPVGGCVAVDDQDSVPELVCDAVCVVLAEGASDADVLCDSDGAADPVTDAVAESDCAGAEDAVAVTVAVGDSAPERDCEIVCGRDAVTIAVPVVDDEADRHSVAEPERDAIVGDAVGVDKSGPMLNVARCVPSIDSMGDADTTEDDVPVADGKPVAI